MENSTGAGLRATLAEVRHTGRAPGTPGSGNLVSTRSPARPAATCSATPCRAPSHPPTLPSPARWGGYAAAPLTGRTRSRQGHVCGLFLLRGAAPPAGRAALHHLAPGAPHGPPTLTGSWCSLPVRGRTRRRPRWSSRSAHRSPPLRRRWRRARCAHRSGRLYPRSAGRCG